MNRVVDLVRCEAAAAYLHAVAAEDGGNRSPVDAEPITEVVDRRAGLVAGDQLFDLFVGDPLSAEKLQVSGS